MAFKPTVFISQIFPEFDPLTIDGGNVDWDLLTTPSAYLNLTENVNFNTPTNIEDGQKYRLIIDQDDAYSVTWDSGYRFPDDIVPVITTGAGSVDYLEFIANETGDLILMSVLKQNLL